MKIEQIYTGCLAHGAYYIESNGEAAVIDPLREIKPYIERAKKDGAKIKFVFETHFHADFVSGHLDLANETGATIVFGPTAKPNFDALIAFDGEIFKVGDVKIKLLHTPGHTMESSSFLLFDETGKPSAIFTGDTLFIGDVGRPDLAVKTNLSREDLAGYLFDSLRKKIMPLDDELIVYPGHGAGSACGKKMSDATTDTLGHQKKFNYALREDMTREEFVKEVTTGLMPPPAYFPKNAVMNRQGYESIEEVFKRGSRALDPAAFEAAAEETEALILDTRNPEVFAEGHIPGSVNIGLKGSFAPWVGALIPDLKQQVLIVCNDGTEQEVITRMARVGYDFAIGYLKGGFASWMNAGKPIGKIKSVTVDELFDEMKKNPSLKVLDVRKVSEYEAQHVEGFVNVPLDYINDNMQMVPTNEPVYVHCQAGYRSVIFISILQARGFNNLIDVKGGFQEIANSGKFPLTRYREPSTML